MEKSRFYNINGGNVVIGTGIFEGNRFQTGKELLETLGQEPTVKEIDDGARQFFPYLSNGEDSTTPNS